VQRTIALRRAKDADREAQRQATLSDLERHAQAEVAHLQERNVHLRNEGGEPYNIITFAYNETSGGDAMRAKVRLGSSSSRGLCWS